MNLCTVVGLQGGGGGGEDGERGREACCNSHGCSSDKLLGIILTVAASYSGV